MSPLASYRRLLEIAGPGYVAIAFLGRLPSAMSQLGTLVLVSGATGSYGTGGLAAGALAVANAVGSPVAGALADRIGQRRVVLACSLAGATGLLALVALAWADADPAALVVAAAAAGLVLPQVGPLARARWAPMTARSAHRRRLVDAAFSYEGAADEASFVLGPALVGVGAVALSPAGALVLAAAMLAVFGTAFALHPSARLTGRADGSTDAGRLVSAALLVLIGAQVCVGAFFGSVQTGTTVLATAAGQAGLAGLVHAVLGIGSVTAGLATVWLPDRLSHQRRVAIAAAGLVVLGAPLLAVDSLATLVPAIALVGCAIAPYMIGVFTLGERVVPPGRVGAAMTLLAAATGLGYALGSATAGRIADASGHAGAFAVTWGATLAALTLALASQRLLARAQRARAGRDGDDAGDPGPRPDGVLAAPGLGSAG